MAKRQLDFEGTKDQICALCKGHHRLLSSPAEWRSEDARAYVLALQVSLKTLVCRPCRDDVTRVLANPRHISRWSKSNTPAVRNKCSALNCKDDAFVSTTLGESTHS